jgi:ATP-binding cassette subfamily C protein
MQPRATARSDLAEALRRYRHAFIGVGLFSGLINILMLTAPLFMLQIYDRVLPSHSIQTLIGLAILAAVLFAFRGCLEAIRSRILDRIGRSVNAELLPRVYDVVRLPLTGPAKADGVEAFVQTGLRTALSYFLKPLTDRVTRTFRDS